jgi:hypothetical protein
VRRKKPDKPDTQEMLRRAVPKRVRDELSKRAKALRERGGGKRSG